MSSKWKAVNAVIIVIVTCACMWLAYHVGYGDGEQVQREKIRQLTDDIAIMHMKHAILQNELIIEREGVLPPLDGMGVVQ